MALWLSAGYPKAARRAKQQGEVTVAICVNSKGRASSPELIKSSGSDALDEETMRNIVNVPFKPGRSADGVPIAWCDPKYVLTISWKLPPDGIIITGH